MLQDIIQGNLVPRMLYYSSLSGCRRRVGEDPGTQLLTTVQDCFLHIPAQ